MKNIIKIKWCLIMIAVGGIFSSCKDYLGVDSYFKEMTSLDSVFTRKIYVDEYIRGAAALLPNEGNLWTNANVPFQGASDEQFTSWDDDRHAAIKFLLDEITPMSGYFNVWPWYYEGIRKASLVLSRINEVPDISDVDRRDFIGRCYFLRGYFYFLLLQEYGPVPIEPETIYKVDESVADMSKERNTYDECIDYIVKEMNLAAQYLPSTRASAADFNIPTSGAALAVASRALLYDASPWYNGNKFYSDWKTSAGKNFINQTYDNSRWGKAAVAAKKLIDTGLYKLYTTAKESDTPQLPSSVSSEDFPNGAGNIDPYRSYSYIFNGEVPAVNDPEFILACTPVTGSDSPFWIAAPTFLGGGNGLNITEDMIDAYRMKDGRDINNSSAQYPYPASDSIYQPIGIIQTFSGYQLLPKAAKMYRNREMRFYVNIGFCHCLWPGTSYTGSNSSYKNAEVTYYADGNAQPNSNFANDYNRTGYTCKKYIHPEDNLQAAGAIRSKTYPIIRYAEILLNYAEALNELNASYTDDSTGVTVTRDQNQIAWAFNQIRYRAGLPGLTQEELSSQSTMRDLIKREREVEFMCEGRRYHDLRRWGDALSAYNRRITGMNVKAKSSERQKFYTVTPIIDAVARRTFTYKNYFWPIPKSVRDKNKKLVQNPGW